MFQLSHKEIIDMLYAEYSGVATSPGYHIFCNNIQNDAISKRDFEDKLVDVLSDECRLAFEAGFKAALQTVMA